MLIQYINFACIVIGSILFGFEFGYKIGIATGLIGYALAPNGN